MTFRYARAAWCRAAMALLLAAPCHGVSAQRRSVAGIETGSDRVSVQRDGLAEAPPGPIRAALEPENRSLLVVVGAALGALGGALLYRRDVRRMNDGDFAAPLSIALYTGGAR